MLTVLVNIRNVLRAIIGYGFYLGGHVVFGLCAVPAVMLLAPFGRVHRTVIEAIFRWYVRFLSYRYLPFIGVYRIVEISGLQRALAVGPAIYAVNHRSRIDGPLMLATVPRSSVVMKAAYGRSPLFAAFVKYLDFISVESGSVSSLAAAMTKARDVIARKRSLIVFPEGTRAPTGRPLPFKDLGLRLAQATGVALIPVVIHSDLPFMAKRAGSYIIPRRLRFTLRFLEPVVVDRTARVSALNGMVEDAIGAELQKLDKGTVWERTSSPRTR